MLIKNCVVNDDGSYDFDFHVDADEASFLMDHAIKNLIHNGIIKINFDEAEQELAIFKQEGGQVS